MERRATIGYSPFWSCIRVSLQAQLPEMILRLSDSFSRGLIVAAALFIAATLSYYSVRMARAAYGADGASPRELVQATRLEPQNPEYWYRLGHFEQFNMEFPDSGLAVQYLKTALALDPHYADAWLDLGTAYELDGKNVEARDAYLQAKKSYPASGEVSWRYANFLLRQGDVQAAYPEFRRSLEVDPRKAATAFSRCFRANPNIDEILNQVFPPIPSTYVDVIKETSDAKQLSLAQLVWRRLLSLHPRLNVRDFEPLVAGLLASGEAAEARRVWDEGTATMHLPERLPLSGSMVWDPSFESGVNSNFFAWGFQSLTQGVTSAYDLTEKHSGNQSLRLTFDGKHNPHIEVACTLVNVSPNTSYHFSAWVKTRNLTSDRGISFHIRPFTRANTGAPSVTSSEIHGTNPWTLIDLTYTAGPDVNHASVCVSRERDLESEVKISGTAWVDDVNLVPQAEESKKK